MNGHTTPTLYKPRLVGTIGQSHSGSNSQSLSCEKEATTSFVSARHEITRPISTDIFPTPKHSQFFKSLEWSADGTTLLTTTASTDFCTLDSFVLPPTLLQSPPPHKLKPYTTHTLPEPTYATTLYPFYNLTEPSTCLHLASLRNLPTRLYSTLGGGVLGSYPLISPTTEAYIAPHSVLFSPSRPNIFFAGSNGIVALFDISRPGEDPVEVTRTGRKKRRVRARSACIPGLNDAEEGLKGIVSTMAGSCDGLLAAGTFSRNIGLYGDFGHGGVDAIFSINQDPFSSIKDREDDTTGTGITQVIWDETGRYLCVAERGSNGVSIWDIRGTGRRLAWLRGRKAKTPQRMGVAVSNGAVWAGGTDGFVRVWEGVGMSEGVMDCDWDFGAHSDAVNGVGLHSGGSVLATCAGQRHFADEWYMDDDDGHRDRDGREKADAHASAFDNSLKVWDLSNLDNRNPVTS